MAAAFWVAFALVVSFGVLAVMSSSPGVVFVSIPSAPPGDYVSITLPNRKYVYFTTVRFNEGGY